MPTHRHPPHAIALLLLFCLAAGAIPPAAMAANPAGVRETVTSAGTTLVQRQPSAPGEAAIVAIMQAGTANQLADETHAAHIAEHMVFQNRQPNQPSLTDKIAAWGGEANGHVGLEHTNIEITVPEGHVRDALAELLASLFTASYDQAVYERELNGYMRVELRNMTANYPTALYNGFRQHIFQGSAYAEDLFDVDIAQVRSETVSGWQQREYGANRLILVVNSSTPWVELCSVVESALHGAPQATSSVPPITLLPPAEGEFVSPGIGNVTAMFGLSLDRIAPNDRAALSFLLELVQRRMHFGAIRDLKPVPQLFVTSWQRDSAYLQLAYEQRPGVFSQGQDPVLAQHAEFAKAVDLLATQLGPGDLRLLKRSTQSSDESGTASPMMSATLQEASELANQYVAEFWSPAVAVDENEQALLEQLQTVAAKYLPHARLTVLRTSPTAPALGPLAVAVACLFALVLLASLTVRLGVKRSASVRILLSLITVMLKSLLRQGMGGGNQDEADKRAFWRWVFAAVLMVAAMWLSNMVAQICMLLGQPELLFVLASAALCLMLFFSGGSLLLSVFLWSGDSERLAALPLPSTHVVLARLLIAILGQYPLSLLVLIPATLKYAQYMGKGPIIWVMMTLVSLLLPILALTLVALPIVAFMRQITPRLRERLAAIVSILLSVALMLFRLTQGSGSRSDIMSLVMQSLQLRQQDLAGQIGRVFPPAVWAGRALALGGTWSGAGNLLLLTLTALLCLWVLSRLSQRLYLGEPSLATPLAGKRKAGKQSDPAGPVFALWGREWKLFWRTPALLAVTLPSTLMPLLIIYPLLSSGSREQGLWVMAQTLRVTSRHSLVPALAAGALAMLVVTSSRLASISISGEGSRFYFSKMIPVAARTQVRAKLLNCLAINGLCILPGLLLVTVWLRLSALTCVAAILASALGLFFATSVCIKHDLAWPRLDWDNTQMLIRQANTIGPSMIILLALAVTAWLAFSLQSSGWAMTLIYALVIGAYAVLGWVNYRSLIAQAEKLYAQIDL